MKNLMILSVLLSTVAFTACRQKENVPAKVKTAFSQKFPNAKKVSWDKENATEWEAEFKMSGKAYSANFDNNGNWKETEFKIEKSEIPATVKSTLDKNYNGYRVEEAEISETATGKVYEFELEKGKSNIEITISPNGEKVKKEENENENEENDDD